MTMTGLMDERDRELSHISDADLEFLYGVVGRLVTEFARAEAYVHLLASTLLKNGHLGSIIFSGMRLGDLIERIRGMLRVQEAVQEEYSDIDACLTQLDLIGKVRHKLAHRFVVMMGLDKIEVHNAYTAKVPEGREFESFHPDQLKDMISDCIRIGRRIARHTDGEARRRERHDPNWLPQLFAPWRYKPSQRA
jgi:hypothetical protein